MGRCVETDVFAMVSQDGAEVAWGKSRARVEDALEHRRTIFHLFAGPVEKRKHE